MAALPGYNPDASLLPAGDVAVVAMRGGGMVGGDGNNESIISELSDPNLASPENSSIITPITPNTRSLSENNGSSLNEKLPPEETNMPDLFPGTDMPTALGNAILERIGMINAINPAAVKEKLIGMILDILETGVAMGEGGIVVQMYPRTQVEEKTGTATAAQDGGRRRIHRTRRQLRTASTAKPHPHSSRRRRSHSLNE